jgi:ribulose-phosphate 3-epimerase
MMINEPIEWLEAVAESAVEMVTGQIEMMSNQGEFVTEAKRLNLRVGLALDLETKLEELDWQITETVDQILIMAVRAGKEEQSFNKDALEKILKLRKMGFDKNICVDGAVGEKTIKACVKAGANILAVGSSLWRAEDVGIQLKKLQQLAETP